MGQELTGLILEPWRTQVAEPADREDMIRHLLVRPAGGRSVCAPLGDVRLSSPVERAPAQRPCGVRVDYGSGGVAAPARRLLKPRSAVASSPAGSPSSQNRSQDQRNRPSMAS